MRGYFIFIVFLVALPAGIAAPAGGVVKGRIVVFASGRKIQPPTDAPAYVFLEESRPSPHKNSFGNNKVAEIVHRGTQFDPHVRVVPVGATVVFPNADTDEHSAFSPTEQDPFNLGRYKQGARPSHKFDDPAEFDIYCDIHKDMWAKVKVVNSDWIAKVENDTFTISDVPPGEYKVVAWFHDSLEVRSDPITVKAGETTQLPVELHVQAGKQKLHKHKDGRPYGPYDP
jgi:plastocyanin